MSELPDAMEAYYEGRQPKLTGVWAEWFSSGTKRLLDYEEHYPASNTTPLTGCLTNFSNRYTSCDSTTVSSGAAAQMLLGI